MAQLDANLILGAKPIQVENPMNQLVKLLQVQDMQQQGQIRNMQMQDEKSAREQSNRLAELYQSSMGADGKIDRNKLYQGAAQRGLGAKIPGLQKQFADADEQTGKVDAANFKLATDRYGMFKKTLGALSQRQDLNKELVMQAGQELVAAGIIPAQMYEQSLANMPDDPNALRSRLREGVAAQMTPEQMFTVFAPKPEKIDSGQQISFRDTNPNSPTFGQNTGGAPVQRQMTPGEIASNQVARGNLGVAQANLGLSRERLALDRSAPRGQFLETQDGYVLGDPRTGQVQPVMGASGQQLRGKTGDKPLTEGQAKAVAFASRMENSEKVIGELAKQGVNASVPGSRLPIVGDVISAAQPGERQQLDQAKRDFINAVLRRESGAVISDSEFSNAERQYFPQIGDAPSVIKQKERNRRVSIDGMRADVPQASQAKVDEISGSGGAPKKGEVVDGYRFKGGNPADPKSWEKQ